MSQTLDNGIVVPINSDAYNLTTDLATMGNKTNVVTVCVNQTARDALVTFTGRTIYRLDTKCFETWNGASWDGKLDYATLRATGSQSFPTGAFTTAIFTTLVEDSNSLTVAVPTSKITVKKGGRYQINGGGGHVSSAGRQGVQLRVNGATVQYGGQLVTSGPDSNGHIALAMTLNANDFVEMQIYNESGASQVGSGAPYSTPFLQVQQVSY